MNEMKSTTAVQVQQPTRLVQPNNLTFSCKNVSALQYNILVLIVEKLQKYMTTANLPEFDRIQVPIFSINASEVSGINHKDRVLIAAVDMTKINFTFDRMDWAAGRPIKGEGPLVTWVDDVQGTNEIRIKLNDMLVPAMTYYGKGVGGTYFIKEQTLKDPSVYTKQIRQMILSWKNRSTAVTGSIDKFKEILGLSPRLTNNRLRTDILEPTRLAILQGNPEVWFEYRFFSLSPIEGRKPKSDHIRFMVYSAESDAEEGRDQYDRFRKVYSCLQYLAPGNSVEYTDKITDLGKLSLISAKWEFYQKKFRTGDITREYMEGVMRKILAEECGIVIIQKA